MSDQQTAANNIYSLANEVIYRLTEPTKLRIARFVTTNKNSQDNPLVSVIIPTFNRSEILMSRAVPSVLRQTHEKFELIVVGDRCTDDTAKLVTNIDDPRVRFIDYQYKKKPYPVSTKNTWLAGEVLAANEGLRQARGQWIARLDDDEEWTDSHISDLLQYAITEDCEFVSGNVEQERHGSRQIVKGEHLFSEYLGTLDFLTSSSDNYRVGGHSTWLYKSYLRVLKYNKNCWRKKTNRVNDVDLIVRFMRVGVKIRHLDKVVTIQRPRPGEVTVGWDAYSNAY